MDRATAAPPCRPVRYDEVPVGTDLVGWARVFAGRGGPRLLAAALVAVAARRARLGGWRWADAAVAASVIGFHPFAEWLIHVNLLHRAPRRRRGRTVELHLARLHRLHHEDPKDIDLVLVPTPELVALVAGLGAVAVAGPDRRRSATGAATALACLLVYEWVHFLIHAPYRPRRWLFRARRRTHRLHHYRNERFWYGVVGASADRLLGTAPARGEVAISPTARTLAGGPGAGEPGAGGPAGPGAVGATSAPG